MKVWIGTSGDHRLLARRIKLQGDQLVGDSKAADVVIRDPAFFPRVSLGLPESRQGRPQYLVTRWFDGKDYGPQAILGIPMFGMMNQNLGKDMPVGCGFTFVRPSLEIDLFTGSLLEMLKASDYNGFVTLVMDEGGLHYAQTSVPYFGLPALLEGFNCRIGTQFVENKQLLEGSCISQVVSRCPYPVLTETPGTVTVDGLTPQVEKHFCPWDVQDFTDSYRTKSTLIGVASAWDTDGFGSSPKQLYRTMDMIQVPDKQHRTDVGAYIKEAYYRLRRRLDVHDTGL